MTQAAKAQEPSMEEILASIRRIIADDEGTKQGEQPPVNAAAAAPAASPKAPAEPAAASQTDIDNMLAEFESEEEAAGAPHASPSNDSGDVLELTEAMEAPSQRSHNFRHIEPSADVVFTDPPPRPRPAAEVASAYREEPRPSLMSESATAAVTSAFGNLAHTVLMQNARTLDDLVREMLRPMLKNWLDENLPTIVERLVRAEIERVSRGRG